MNGHHSEALTLEGANVGARRARVTKDVARRHEGRVGRAVLSAANLSKPGTFDPETMDLQRFGGLSLFAVLPGPKPPLKAFEDLLATARNLNERLQGALQDERGGPLTPTRIATIRESLGTEATS